MSRHLAVTDRPVQRQRGAALVTSLIILLLLTLIGVTSMQSATLQEKMAGNLRDQYLAFQAAEAALRAGEAALQGTVGPFVADSGPTSLAIDSSGFYQPTLSPTLERWLQPNIWSTGSRSYAVTLAGLTEAPRYIIEDMSSYTQCTSSSSCTSVPLPKTPGGSLKFGQVPDTGRFRVTARGVGGTANAVVLLQSYYTR